MKHLKLMRKVLGPENRHSLEELVKEYIEDELLCKHLKLTEEDKKIFVQTYVEIGLKGASLGYFTGDTNELIGCGIASLSSYHIGPDSYAKYGEMSPQFQALARFDEFMEQEVTELAGGGNVMTFELGFVKPKYRKLGLSIASKNETRELAQKLSCDAAAIVLNADYTVNSFIKIGFIPVKTIKYKDYRDPETGKAIFTGLPSAYTSCTLLVMPLKNARAKL